MKIGCTLKYEIVIKMLALVFSLFVLLKNLIISYPQIKTKNIND
jgi:hypothetical protein